MSAVVYPCPGAPPETLYESLGKMRPHDTYMAKPPADPSDRVAMRAYEKKHAHDLEIVEIQKTTLVEFHPGPLFLCGSIKQEPHCNCGHVADFLCDYPIGNGKTCDLSLCWCCRKSAGEELDMCRIHFVEFKAKSGVERVNEWPPRKR